MLNFDDDVAPAAQPRLMPSTPETLRAQAIGTIGGGILSREPVHDLDVDRQALENGFRRVRVEDKRVINGAVRRQPAGAVQVQVGVGQVPRRLRQPLDAAGSQHAARHRAVEEPATA